MTAPYETHPDLDRLTAFGLGGLSDDESDAIGRHVAACCHCRQTLEAAQRTLHAPLTGGPRPPSAPHPAVPGYEILEEVGRGGMGVVYRARQAGLGRVVALKTVPADAAEEDLARFRREAAAAARLRHPNLMQVYEVGESGGRPYLAMEFVEGGTLARRLDGVPLPPVVAAGLVETLARAVQYAHERGVVHRDLKPANVLLDPTAPGDDGPPAWLAGCAPKIADFGLARTSDAPAGTTRTGEVLGTPAYMAPEQAAGGKGIGPATDIYALGAVLYECLTGRPPFRAATVLETLDLVRSAEAVPPARLQPKVPRDLQTVCLKCLEKEPRKRYATAGALADDLRRFREGRPVVARPAGPARRLLKWARRNPALAALLAAALLGAAGLAGGVAIHSVRLRAEAKRADAHYQNARDALMKLLGRLEVRRAGDVPGLRELQRQQLDDARAFFEGALAENGGDPQIQHDTAAFFLQAGSIHVSWGRPAPAADCFRRAHELLADLTARHPCDRAYAGAYAECLVKEGYLAAGEGRPGEAEATYRDAAARFDALHAADPAEPRWSDGASWARHNLGSLYQTTDRRGPAEKEYRAALALRRAALGSDPSRGKREGVAETTLNLALLCFQQGRRDKAGPLFAEADALLRGLVAEDAGDLNLLSSFGANLCNRALLLLAEGKAAEARACYDEGIERLEPALRAEPELTGLRSGLLNLRGGRAQLNFKAERWAEAACDWGRVVELCDAKNPGRLGYRMAYAVALAHAGDYARAEAEAGALRRPPPGPPDLYNLACVYALCVPAAEADAARPEAERQSAAGRLAGEALGLLRQARERGFFKDPANVAQLGKDPDLDALRGLSEFKEFAREVAGRDR
jgi:tetratricopeptide (TPR) repeat protein